MQSLIPGLAFEGDPDLTGLLGSPGLYAIVQPLDVIRRGNFSSNDLPARAREGPEPMALTCAFSSVRPMATAKTLANRLQHYYQFNW